jgi:hypothetical protein
MPLFVRAVHGRGGGWVVAQGILILCWLFLTPKGHKLAGSALARAFAAVLLTAGVVAGVSGAWVLGKSLTPFRSRPHKRNLSVAGSMQWCDIPSMRA